MCKKFICYKTIKVNFEHYDWLLIFVNVDYVTVVVPTDAEYVALVFVAVAAAVVVAAAAVDDDVAIAVAALELELLFAQNYYDLNN